MKYMDRIQTWARAGFVVAAGAVALPAHATETVSGHVTGIGCHSTDNTCFVTLDSAPFGTTLGCTGVPAGGTQQFRFDNGDTAQGRRTYASMLWAMQVQRVVEVTLNGCNAQGVPAIAWFNM